LPTGTKQYYVYLLTNQNHRVLYIGVTSDLYRRISEHREKRCPGFTARYNVHKLVYFESYLDVWNALEREKQLKIGARAWKIELITQQNPAWVDLFSQLVPEE
jgi:putative endonuclease